jgi:cell division protein FtsL
MKGGGLLMLLAIAATAIGVVWSTHAHRQTVGELEILRQEQARLEVEWGQLQLEEAALAHPGRIESAARERLRMRLPADQATLELAP